MVIALSLLLTAAVAWALLRPHFLLSAQDSPQFADNIGVLQDQRERCVQVLRDLELDYSTGKLTEEEYRSMKGSLSQELAKILSELDAQV